MDRIKLHDLRCFDAVATKGSFQAAGTALNRSHPSVFAAVARLEQQLGLTLFDRSGYRIGLTDAGRTFHARAQVTLRELDLLQGYAEQLASGEEMVLRIVIGDLCPRPPVLQMLSGFFARYPNTRLHLEYEAVGGPLERLIDDDVDLVFHRAEPSDPRFEQIKLSSTTMVPVRRSRLSAVCVDEEGHARANAPLHAVRDPRHGAATVVGKLLPDRRCASVQRAGPDDEEGADPASSRLGPSAGMADRG
ncbi:DNA-binding transcriptional LysR family regulator [Bradyrhizobium elkanii]